MHQCRKILPLYFLLHWQVTRKNSRNYIIGWLFPGIGLKGYRAKLAVDNFNALKFYLSVGWIEFVSGG